MESTRVDLIPAPGAPLRTGAVEVDDLTRAARRMVEAKGWTLTVDGPWAYASPPDARLPEQGWKLHISATDKSADAVLAAVVPHLIAAGAPFKLAANRRIVGMLNSATAERASGGKFITVYPLHDGMATAAAGACHEATAGLSGPAILSDRPYRPNSLVHYRYGGFVDRQAIDADGVVLHLIRTPDGDLIPDERKPAYSAPAWVTDPFVPASPPTAEAPSRPSGPVVLHDRYTVRAALQHANKGGTYLAEDGHTGLHVVIKEGRPHVAAGSPGGDARDRIRHEGGMLTRLAPTGRVPQVVELFEQQGHVFLVMDHVPDPSLRDLIEDAFEPPAGGLAAVLLVTLAANLARAVADVHATGIVLRDLNPNNVLVAPDGQITLIDLEMAQPVGTVPSGGGGTPGYGSPEQLQGGPATFADDAWSLGATLAFAASAADPFLPVEANATWTDPLRLREWVARLVVSCRMEPALARLVLAAMAERPDERLDAGGIAHALTAERPARRLRGGGLATGRRPGVRRGGRPADTRLGLELDLDALSPAEVPDAVAAWLISAMGTGTGGHLWPVGPTGAQLDPVNIQAGASGVGLFLCHLADASTDARVREAVAATAEWVSDRIDTGPARPPGLHFGLSGAVWFLTRASAVLGRDDLMRRANELALRLPVRSPNPDLAHGTAGVGLGQLHQWMRTGDDRFLARAVLAADHLVRTAERDADGAVTWPIPADAPSRLAGTVSYGFAHGTAGVATFLLVAGAATTDASFTATATQALDGLLELAVFDDDDAAFWPMGPDDDTLWAHWCNGSSGVGTAMLRAFQVTGDVRYREAAEAAALAGWRERWRSSTVQCHGLAGNAEFLLDVHQVTGEARFQVLAAEAAEVMLLQRRRDGDHTVFADDTGAGLSAAYGTGMAGLAMFFLRLTGGGRRALMLDQLIGVRR